MTPLFETVTDLHDGADVLRRRRYGVIEVVDGRLRRIRLRPFPKLISAPEVLLLGRWIHRRRRGDRFLVFYNHPRRHDRFMAVTYTVSNRDSTLASAQQARDVLEEIARLKGIDALLCDVATSRISERLLRRWGWEPHAPVRWHRNFIKRFVKEAAAPLSV
ncbi:MAG: hypothetical protein HQ581_23630 [Planctomycetes bacterium]|nr:hypothetical protein [Planctomycetota bacterium]